jgi:AcrR family transcriptional regulator
VTFQRARSAEQREQRRRAILDAATALLERAPVAELSLTALARQAGLAKSNVLRYFESREAVLLELLDAASRDWLAGLPAELDAGLAGPAGDGPVAVPVCALPAGLPPPDPAPTGTLGADLDRADRIAGLLARSLAARPMLCDLVSAQAAVLEHNVSPEVAARFKRTSMAHVAELGGIVRERLPGLGERAAWLFAGMTVYVAGAVWTYTQPSEAMRTAYERDPELAAQRMDVREALELFLATALAGVLARAGR